MDFYNHTRQLFTNGNVDITNLFVILTNGYTFSASETDMTAINSAEVSGNGWTAGGEAISNAVVTITNTNESTLDGDNISVTATGGDIGPADAFVVYDGTNSNPLFHYGFSSSQTSPDGDSFNITWNSSGVARWRSST